VAYGARTRRFRCQPGDNATGSGIWRIRARVQSCR
jgi:hypothetical protein